MQFLTGHGLCANSLGCILARQHWAQKVHSALLSCCYSVVSRQLRKDVAAALASSTGRCCMMKAPVGGSP